MSGFVSIYAANPSGTLTRPADTSAYAQNDLIASSTTAASVSVPYVNAARATENSGTIIRGRLYTNATSGWSTTFAVNLWKTAPTYTNGDNGVYAVATGAAGFLGAMPFTLTQVADGAYGAAAPNVGNGIVFGLPTNQRPIYWDLQYTGAASLTPIASQTFTLELEVLRS